MSSDPDLLTLSSPPSSHTGLCPQTHQSFPTSEPSPLLGPPPRFLPGWLPTGWSLYLVPSPDGPANAGHQPGWPSPLHATILFYFLCDSLNSAIYCLSFLTYLSPVSLTNCEHQGNRCLSGWLIRHLQPHPVSKKYWLHEQILSPLYTQGNSEEWNDLPDN